MMTSNGRVKLWLKPPDQMDLWLAAQGYYRKHTARDGTCLFRAISEQLFLTQAFHLEVRRHCIEFGFLHKHLFEQLTKSSIEDRLDRLKCPSEGGGYLELNIISKMYRCDFILFQEVGKPPVYGTNNGFEKKITLCMVQERHYDSVYTKERITNAAFCQSLIYETLYKDVFGLLEVDYAVKKMLRDKSSRYQREHTNFLQNGMDLRLEMRDNCTNVKELLNLGVTPFPYKVAKSLDPEIYRNVEYDTWNEYRKGLRYVKKVWNSHELGPGARCLVKLGEGKVFHAFVQEMEPNKGPVLVFIEEMGEKMSVPYESLELIPMPVVQQITGVAGKHNVRQLQAAKISPTQQQPEVVQSPGKKSYKNGNKIKNNQVTELKNKNCGNIDGSNENNPTSVPIVSSSDYSQNHEDYQLNHEMQDNYQNQAYVTQSCEVTSSVSEIEENGKVDSQHHQTTTQIVQSACPPNSLYPINGAPDTNNNYPPTSVPSYCAVNIVPNRSVLPDGSDLPLTDISAVRYFYNLGLDYYVRMNCVMRPDIPANGPCYPVIPSPTQYLPEPPHISYVNFTYEQPPLHPNQKSCQSMVTTSDGPVAPVREPVPASPGVVSVTSESSSSSHSVSYHPISSSSHRVAPRFKNKRKLTNNNTSSYNNHNNAPRDLSSNSSNNAHHNNGKYHGPPLLQQSDVSTTCTSPITPVPPIFPVAISPHPPPPPAAALPPSVQPPPPSLPPPNHYLPVQPSYTPPNAPPTFYFQPVECDNYCPVTVGGYFEYSVIEPPPPGMYPALLSQPAASAQFSSAPYLTADGIYYQQVVPSTTM